jgi:hypothetical protein
MKLLCHLVDVNKSDLFGIIKTFDDIDLNLNKETTISYDGVKYKFLHKKVEIETKGFNQIRIWYYCKKI